MKKILTTITIILSLHLWYSNADLLIAAKELATKDVSIFSYIALTLFALSYSVLTSVAVVKMQRYINVFVFALLDGFAVYLRINVNQEHFILISSIFYAVYTAYIISVCWLLNRQQSTSTAKEPTTPQIQSTLTAIPEYSETEEEKKIRISAIRRISGSGKNPETIKKVISEVNNENVKQYLEDRYAKD
ncbi:MAG: hypothetical protein IJ150_07495 [Bacteroidales bacterium]|nr:hypothetical protein [Bacteroidales bacterium]